MDQHPADGVGLSRKGGDLPIAQVSRQLGNAQGDLVQIPMPHKGKDAVFIFFTKGGMLYPNLRTSVFNTL